VAPGRAGRWVGGGASQNGVTEGGYPVIHLNGLSKFWKCGRARGRGDWEIGGDIKGESRTGRECPARIFLLVAVNERYRRRPKALNIGKSHGK
jgi:hypothetical protein